MKKPMVLILVDYFSKMVTNPLLKSGPFLHHHHHHHFFVTSKVTFFPFNRMIREVTSKKTLGTGCLKRGKGYPHDKSLSGLKELVEPVTSIRR